MSITIHSLTLIKRAVFLEKPTGRRRERRHRSRMNRGSLRGNLMEDVVPEVPTEDWNLNAEQVTKIINGKKNWSSPGPDRIANFW